MIRRIAISHLRPGMFVVDVHKGWLEHNVWRTRFKVRDEAHVRLLEAEGISEVSIDTGRGPDIPPIAEPMLRLDELERPIRQPSRRFASRPRQVSLGEERRRAGRLLRDAGDTLQQLMLAAQIGGQVEAGRLEPLVTRMIESIGRNPDGLVPLARLKERDAYAAYHGVATAGLIIALGQQQALPEPEIEKLALGTLLKDIGHAAIDENLFDKRGTLSPDEYSLIQSHVEEGLAVLEATTRLAETSVAVVLEHHERYNGSGYPYCMSGDDISLAGRMAAIVDTYDAMTSERPYRPAISPAVALQQLYMQGGNQFDPGLIAAFVRTVGIYPVGTLVLLESGHLAVVEQEHPEQLLSPVVRVIYHSGRRQYVTPLEVDLARRVGNHYGQIVRAENYETWGLSPLRWQPT